MQKAVISGSKNNISIKLKFESITTYHIDQAYVTFIILINPFIQLKNFGWEVFRFWGRLLSSTLMHFTF